MADHIKAAPGATDTTGNHMRNEHDAWLDLCGELSAIGVDINNHDALTAKIKIWGERLHRLRHEQGEVVALKAFIDAQIAADNIDADRLAYSENPEPDAA